MKRSRFVRLSIRSWPDTQAKFAGENESTDPSPGRKTTFKASNCGKSSSLPAQGAVTHANFPQATSLSSVCVYLAYTVHLSDSKLEISILLLNYQGSENT